MGIVMGMISGLDGLDDGLNGVLRCGGWVCVCV